MNRRERRARGVQTYEQGMATRQAVRDVGGRVVVIDHERLIDRDPDEVKKLAEASVGLRGGLVMLSVEHEANDECCAVESWTETLLSLIQEAQ